MSGGAAEGHARADGVQCPTEQPAAAGAAAVSLWKGPLALPAHSLALAAALTPGRPHA